MNTTRIEGITWKAPHRYRRSCCVAGRHFVATRDTGDWTVSEIADGIVHVLAEDIETAELSGFVYDVLMGAEPGPESTRPLAEARP